MGPTLPGLPALPDLPAPQLYDRPHEDVLVSPRSSLVFAQGGADAAEQTWTGKIADSACGAKHEEAAEGQGVMADRECTQACVRGGSKYVLVVDGKVMQIANQDNKDLATHAGHAGQDDRRAEGQRDHGRRRSKCREEMQIADFRLQI